MEVTITDDDVAILHLGSDQNLINFDFLKSLHKALDEVESAKNVKAMVSTASGKFFCNGIDLEKLYVMKKDDMKTFFNEFFKGLKRILTLPFPTVAALNGHAFAGGAFIALCHDYTIMSSSKGWLCFNEIHMKMAFGNFLLPLLRLKIPPGTAFTNAAVMGTRYTAERAYQDRLIHGYCEREKLMDTTMAYIKTLFVKDRFDRGTMKAIKQEAYEALFNIEPSKL